MRNIAKCFVGFVTGIWIPYMCYAADLCTPEAVYGSCSANVGTCPTGYYKSSIGCPSGMFHCVCCPSGWQSCDSGLGKGTCCKTKQCAGSMFLLTYAGHSEQVSGASQPYHLEYVDDQLECVGNSKSCNEFPFFESVPYPFDVSGNWEQSEQYGIATWGTDTWNFSNCNLGKENVNITNKNCTGSIWSPGWSPECKGSAATGFSIKYGEGNSYYFCTACNQGKKPNIVSLEEGLSSFAFYFHQSNTHVVDKCNDVETGHYSTGCDFKADYPLTSVNFTSDMDDCHQQCEEGQTTLGPGASSCVWNSQNSYTDATGTFYFAPDAACL